MKELVKKLQEIEALLHVNVLSVDQYLIKLDELLEQATTDEEIQLIKSYKDLTV